jgi:hypothetical protein
MAHSKNQKNVVAVILLVCLSAAQLPAQTTDALQGRDLLRVVRDRDGLGPKPAYENRFQETSSPAQFVAADEPETPQEPPPAPPEPEEPVVREVTPSPPPPPTGDGLLGMIPAESMFCLRINNLDFTLSQIDQFLAGVSPLPMGTSVLIRTNLAGLLGSPDLKGLNMAGSFAAFGPLPGTDMTGLDNVGLLVPVTDYKLFVGGNPNISEPDERGISRIAAEGLPPSLVTQARTHALISPQGYDSQLLVMAKAISSDSMSSLADSLDPTEAKRAATEAVWAYGNVQQASKTFGPLLSGWLEQAKQATQGMEANQQAAIAQLEAAINELDPSDPAQKAKIEQLDQQLQMLKTTKADAQTAETLSMVMDMYAALLETLMNETKSVSLMLTPRPDVLHMTIGVSAVPGTCIADLFTTDLSAREQNKFLPYLEDGAVMNFATSKFLGKLNAKSMEFFVPKFFETFGVDK